MTGTAGSGSLGALAQATGAAVRTAANLPVDLNDPASIWYVERGAADVFLRECRDGREVAAPQHVIHAEAGRLLVGVALEASGSDFSLVAKGLPDTLLRRLPATALQSVDSVDAARQVDAWVAALSARLFERSDLPLDPDVLVERGKGIEEARGTLGCASGVIWVPDTGLYMGVVEAANVAPPADGDTVIPLTPDTWLTLFDATSIVGVSSETLARAGLLLESLRRFHSVAFATLCLDRLLMRADDANLQVERTKLRHSAEHLARLDLYHLLRPDREVALDSVLFSVLARIGRHEGIKFRKPPRRSGLPDSPGLTDILDVSGVRCRRVRLLPEEKWWHGDSGAILAFRSDSGEPVALLPDMLGRYREVDASGTRRVRVSAERARALAPQGFMFYRPFPAGRAGAADLAGMARGSLGRDFARFGLTGLAGGLVMLVPPVVIGVIADAIIPAGDGNLLYLALAALAGFAVLGALLHVVQGTALMRVEARMTARLEAGLWDRMLRLPPGFRRRYSAGDLAMRGMTFQALRDSISGLVANAALSLVFLLPAFALMVYHDAALGAVGAAMGLLSLAVVVVLGLYQIPHHRRILASQRRLTGRLFQFIEGIAKLRSCSAERSAFAQWARQYLAQKQAEVRLHGLNVHLLGASAGMPVLAIAAMLAIAEAETTSVGDFLVVVSAFLVFQMALLRLGASFSAVAAIIPACEQALPILHETPQSSITGASVNRLGGEISLDRVRFRYDPDGPLVIDDVSMHVGPGEFVAIAGESGSGKSTLLRLALGLETPLSGTVYFDGRDIKGLNLKQLRRNIGVVPQETALMPEDIWDNIAGDDELATEDAVWRAARLAAVDRDIAGMPMGFHTGVGKSAATLSGGESQRVLIAGALYSNPRILMLDEATNWLDNENQTRVMRNIESLSSSKLVIAHRLSTLQHADRIYVMQHGRVVQQGTYEGLIGVEGVFRDLVRRQMA